MRYPALMRRYLILALPLVLTMALLACAGPGSGSGPEAACEREAEENPEVRRLSMIALGNPSRSMEVSQDLSSARARAKRDCLARAGLRAPGGGVEPVSRGRSLFDGLR